jgi:hypothetical protein
MHWFSVGLSVPISVDELDRLLRQRFPLLEVATLDLERDAPWPPIVFSIFEHQAPDFKCHVEFANFPGPEQSTIETGIALAHWLAQALHCNAICDGTGYGEHESPYWSIIANGIRLELADDSDSAYMGDSAENPVRKIHTLDILIPTLDEAGQLITLPAAVDPLLDPRG